MKLLQYVKKCGTYWCTLNEYELFDLCEKCGVDSSLEYYCSYEDVENYLKKSPASLKKGDDKNVQKL